MCRLGQLLLLLCSAAALASAARTSARSSSPALPVMSAANTQQVQPSYTEARAEYYRKTEPEYIKSDRSYGNEGEEETAYSSNEPRVITLELLKQDSSSQATPQSANSTRLSLGVACSQGSSDYYNDVKYDSYSDDEEDLGPLIQGTPLPIEQIGQGRANISWRADQTAVEVERQRGLRVATLTGEFHDFEDAASCSPLLTRRARITFTDVPVYAMVTRTTLPLDPSMLSRLLPLNSQGSSDNNSNTPNIPNIPIIPNIPGGAVLPALPNPPQGSTWQTNQTQGNAIIHTGTNTVSSAPQVAVASASSAAAAAAAVPADSGYYEEQALCGLTLVAKGAARLQVQGSDRTYVGHVESTLLWTNGIITLPGFMADAVAASAGQSTQSLFSTTVNQVLTSYVSNGVSNAQLWHVTGNSASTTVMNPGSTADTFGGNVNVTMNDNIASADSDNATMVAGDSVTGNRVNVFNTVGTALEQYLRLLKTMCKHHKDIPESKPGRIRFDLSPARL